MPGEVQVGIEVDDARATVVTVHGGTVADIKTVTGSTADDALDRAVAAISPSDPVRLALVTDGLVVSRVDVTQTSLTHASFSELAYRVTGAPREGTTTAGLLFDESGTRTGLLAGGVAAVAPADPIDRVYTALRGRHVEVVPAPFVVGELEGVSLALRFNNAELTLVADGRPVAHRQLAAGGLAVVEAVLGGGTAAGSVRVADALRGRSADPIAVSALERYLRSVFTDVRDVLDEWARAGERVSREVYVHGPGASARSLSVLMADAHLVRAEHTNVSRALVHLAPDERASAVTAYLAAATFGRDLPYAAFVPPDKVRQFAGLAGRRRRRRRIRVLTAAAAILALGTGAPVVVGETARQTAEQQLDDIQVEVEKAKRTHPDAWTLTNLQEMRDQLSSRGQWADVPPAIATAAPADVFPEHVSLRARGDDVAVEVNGRSTRDAAVVDDYARALETKVEARDVLATDIAESVDGVTFTLTFTVPGGAR